MRIYDNRLGRFLSVNPITMHYPELTPYQFASNSPIVGIDRDGLELEPYTVAKAVQSNREETERLRKIDPRLAQAFNDKGNTIGITFVGGALVAGWGANVAATSGFRTLLTNMFKGGAVGAGINGLLSWQKGGDGYEIVKSSTSGFVSGAMLGIGWGNSFIGSFLGGGAGGSIGGLVNQEFDNRFGEGSGYNLERIEKNGGIGAVANVLSSSLVDKISQAINNKLTKAVAETETAAYRAKIKAAILQWTPRIGERQLKVAINQSVKEVQDGLKKEATAVKVGVQQAIERGIDKLSDMYNDSTN